MTIQLNSHLRTVTANDLLDAASAGTVFEGQPVTLCRARLTAVAGLELDDVHQIDDIVRIVVEGTVTGIGHIVDPISGNLIRVHTVKVHDATPLTADAIVPAFDV